MPAPPLRLGFDMDGVLADFAAAFHDIEVQLFGPSAGVPAEQPEHEEARQASQALRRKAGRQERARETRRRRDAIWREIQATPDFWTSLPAVEQGAVRRLHQLTLRHRWEVFFITQRPATLGETVQRQTQRWLIEQGFDLPSVLVVRGTRGAAVRALDLDYHVDDSAQNCLDVLADSRAKAILVTPEPGDVSVLSARRLGIGVTTGINAALDILDQATHARLNPSMLKKLARMVGWK